MANPGNVTQIRSVIEDWARIDVRGMQGDVDTMDVGLAWRRKSERTEAAFCELLATSFTTTVPHYPA